MTQADISSRAFRGLLCVASAAALLLSRPVWFAERASGTDIPGHVVMTRFGVDELFAHARWDGWFPGFGSGYRLFAVNGPGMALLVGAIRAGSWGTVSASRALVLLGMASLAALPWAVAWFSREMGSSRLAATIHGALALLVGYHAGGGVTGLYAVGLLAHGLALPLVLVALVLLRRAIRDGDRRSVAGAALVTGFLGLLHPISVLVLALLAAVLLAPDVVRRPAASARRAALVAVAALGSVAFWLAPALRDRALAGDATFWAGPAPLPRRIGDVVAGRVLVPWGVGAAVLLALVAMVGWAAVDPRARAWLRGPAVAVVALLVADLAVTHQLGPFELREHLPMRLATIAMIMLMQPLAVVLAEAAQLVARRAGDARLAVAAGLVVAALVPWFLRGDRNPARAVEAPTAAFAAAADELAVRVPPMGRHVLARPPDPAYRDGSNPSRWLAAASGTNTAHLYLWEATRENAAGELSQQFLDEVEPDEALDRLRRLGVTHVVVTDADEVSLLRRSPGYHRVWQQDDVAIFAVGRAPGRPVVGALLQPAEAADPDDPEAGEGKALTLAAVPRAQEPELVAWDVDAPEAVDVVAAVAHDPHWQVRVDGDLVPVARSDEGLVQFTLPAGEHDVELRYVVWAEDRLWLAVSLLSLALVGAYAAGVAVPVRLTRRAAGPEPAERAPAH